MADAEKPQTAGSLAGSDGNSGNPDNGKTPRTERGRKTLRALLNAAATEFGAKGFYATGITDITRRANLAPGSFYTYFSSKEEIFRALIKDLSQQVKEAVTPHIESAENPLLKEKAAFDHFLTFVQDNQQIYRIIDESEFVTPDAHRDHYYSTVGRIITRLQAGAKSGELRPDIGEIEAWAIAGINVFLGLRYGVWGSPDDDLTMVSEQAHKMVAKGLAPDTQ